MLTGLLRPTSGTVRVCGHDLVGDVRRATRAIGYVPDEPFLYDKLSGREFLEFIAEMRGLDRATLDDAIQRECHNFSLDEFIDDLTETYSHGMKQRLAFASALLHDAPVLVIDEPMVGLDPRSMRAAKDRLRTLAAAGKAVFISTHTLAIAEEIADCIGIMDRGRLHFLGTVAELQHALASRQTSLELLFLEMTERPERPRHEDGRRKGGISQPGSQFPAGRPLRRAAVHLLILAAKRSHASTRNQPFIRARVYVVQRRGPGVRADAVSYSRHSFAANVVAVAISRVAGGRAHQPAVGRHVLDVRRRLPFPASDDSLCRNACPRRSAPCSACSSPR